MDRVDVGEVVVHVVKTVAGDHAVQFFRLRPGHGICFVNQFSLRHYHKARLFNKYRKKYCQMINSLYFGKFRPKIEVDGVETYQKTSTEVLVTLRKLTSSGWLGT